MLLAAGTADVDSGFACKNPKGFESELLLLDDSESANGFVNDSAAGGSRAGTESNAGAGAGAGVCAGAGIGNGAGSGANNDRSEESGDSSDAGAGTGSVSEPMS